MVLFGIGGLATLGSVLVSVERRYIATIAAPQGVSWNLWLPAPEPMVAATSDGEATVHGLVETPNGSLLNVTGVGRATLRFEAGSLEWLPPLSPDRRGFELTGRQGTPPNLTFAVWRGTLDPSANLSVHGLAHWEAGNLEGSLSCGGPGYSGPLSEGWNHLPVGIGDCFGLITSVPFFLPSLFFVSGGIVLVLNHRRTRPTT